MKNIILLLLLLLVTAACKESEKQRITRLVQAWDGKEIIFPDDAIYTIYGKDTVAYPRPNAAYTIVSYIDSVGCTSCKLQLMRWSEYMHQLDSISSKEIAFQFIFHPKNTRDLIHILRRDRFDFPVWLDQAELFNKANALPEDRMFHTFLLDTKHRVVALGNPVENPKIKELYQKVITGKVEVRPALPTTSVVISKKEINLGEFDWTKEQEQKFSLQNTGKNALVVQDVIASCACIKVSYSREPVQPGHELEFVVLYSAISPEYIHESLKIYANTEASPLVIKVKGESREEN
ncbi:DUF1573 domain-containing protein [Bacteroides sp. 214]|uniref:DUF1573 domain-containing protein n=1 Tax=Bacteroides sp. 214 TaxID=2302935 RepID=UPI0013D0A419|nr:DUF1573 domain-containing protein [Bacteroides sp. 214]NDW11627.1 DUF1573 domain-containing protein [Bacteroides sp. 214]